ncbi:protein-L-isoaspartate(D-aspartate) O-methyltransferase [Martelella endophytica]|uniref:Protein-L-isoaspartate O-methyltransferase n=1 Tax=Martelella endophytica TaxID=1486262 RepID=A0A0D5LVN0_MAREN|nr:protein-L-isoaspartate(D-aspartate) O-methyltransferase [Martelella endophytica]AJY48329.1 protein-L-isoaspartate O-methyltransferase [Martelella endophytica]
MATKLQEREGFAALVMQLRSSGVTNLDLLAAVEATPRSLFTPSHLTPYAYSGRSLPIECGAFMESADLAIRLLDLLRLKPGQRVLEVGTGSGYTAAIIGRIVERVLSVERYRTLTENARQRMSELGLRSVVLRQADGREGLSGEGTFDRIFYTVALPEIPRARVEQLVSNGVIMAPLLREGAPPLMVRMTRIGSRFERQDLFEVPYLAAERGVSKSL